MTRTKQLAEINNNRQCALNTDQDGLKATTSPNGHETVQRGPITLSTDRGFIVASDLLIPFQNDALLDKLLSLKAAHFPDIENLILNGELFDLKVLCDLARTGDQSAFIETLVTAGNALQRLMAAFKWTFIVAGHYSNAGDGSPTVGYLVNTVLGDSSPMHLVITVSEFDYMYVDGATRGWIVGHPKGGDGCRNQTPAQIADLYRRDCISAHSHGIGISPSPSGDYLGIDAGHMTLEDCHFHKNGRLSKYSRWNAGFVVVHGDCPHVFALEWTDWDSLLGCKIARASQVTDDVNPRNLYGQRDARPIGNVNGP